LANSVFYLLRSIIRLDIAIIDEAVSVNSSIYINLLNSYESIIDDVCIIPFPNSSLFNRYFPWIVFPKDIIYLYDGTLLFVCLLNVYCKTHDIRTIQPTHTRWALAYRGWNYPNWSQSTPLSKQSKSRRSYSADSWTFVGRTELWKTLPWYRFIKKAIAMRIDQWVRCDWLYLRVSRTFLFWLPIWFTVYVLLLD
jgi:hypothetical protein